MATPSGPQKERRTFRRVLLRLPIQFRPDGVAGEWQPGMTKDISAVGTLFATDHSQPLGTRLVLSIPVPEEERARELTGTVVRTEYRDDAKGYLVGVTFSSLTEADRAHLSAILYSSDIVELLRKAVELDASDVHLSANHPPMARVAGRLFPVRKSLIAAADVQHMIFTLLDERQRAAYQRDLELNFSLSVEPTIRFRVNVHSQRGNVEAAFRRIQPAVRSIAELNLPAVLEELAELSEGLVLITGRSGAGKTTTAAALIDRINSTRSAVIITLENPIEYVYTYKKSLVKQREIGVDTHSIQAGLREAMRQNPDVIFVGEVTDEGTMKAMLETAESGHLVIATMAAGDCVQSISRGINFFRKDRQQDAQHQLANSLRAIIYQKLVPRSDTDGVVPVTEVLTNTQAVGNLLRTGNLSQLSSVIQVSMKQGMHSLDSSLQRFYKKGLISRETYHKHRQGLVELEALE